MNKKEIHITYGTDAKEMVYSLLCQLDIKQDLTPDTRIGLKPNLVLDKKASEGATTSPELVEGIIRYFKDNGFDNIAIILLMNVKYDFQKVYGKIGIAKLASRKLRMTEIASF